MKQRAVIKNIKRNGEYDIYFVRRFLANDVDTILISKKQKQKRTKTISIPTDVFIDICLEINKMIEP